MTQVPMNPRGIPRAPFVDNVPKFMTESVEATLAKFDEMLSKYKYMELSKQGRKASLEGKIPEIQKTLDAVGLLISKKNSETDVTTLFELNDTLLAKAKLKKSDTVYLWLGANVMLEYTLDEAKTLLSEKLASAKVSLEQTVEDLAFLREQITTMEVNMARIYNWDVKRLREKQANTEKASAAPASVSIAQH